MIFLSLSLEEKSTKKGCYEFMSQKISNRESSKMEILSLPLSSSSKYLRKEAHHLLHLDYLHSKKEERKMVYNP